MTGRARFLNEKEGVAYVLKHNVSVDVDGRRLTVTGAGLKVLGAIDFLRNFHGYFAIYRRKGSTDDNRRQDHAKELQGSQNLGG
jgi:hypothetical protein